MADEQLPIGQQGNKKLLAEVSTGIVAETVNLTTAIGVGAVMMDVWGTSTGAAIVTDTSGTMQQYSRGLVRTIGASTDAAIVTDSSGTVAGYLRGLVRSVGGSSDTAVVTDSSGTLESYARGLVRTVGGSSDAAVLTDTSGTLAGYARGLVRTVGGSSDTAVVTDTSGTISAYTRGLVKQLGSSTDAVVAGGAEGSLSAKLRRVTQDVDRLFIDHSRHEFVEHPFARGSLTTDGVQYSAPTTTLSTEWSAVETATIDPPYGGNIVELEFGLTASVAGSSVAVLRTHKWQAATVGSTWVDLMTFTSTGAGSTAYIEQTHSGYFSTGNANLSALPMQVRLVVQSTAVGTVTGRTKTSSYVRCVVEST